MLHLDGQLLIYIHYDHCTEYAEH